LHEAKIEENDVVKNFREKVYKATFYFYFLRRFLTYFFSFLMSAFVNKGIN